MPRSQTTAPIIVLIIAGGKGARFWPRSTRDNPKQLQKIYSNKTLLEETYLRACLLTKPEYVFVGCSAKFQKIIRKKHPRLFKRKSFIIEPEGRNTAPIIAWASLVLSEAYPDSIQVVLPADHYINPSDEFANCIQSAIQIARSDYLVTLGIQATRPDNQYGYIQAESEIKETLPPKALAIKSFTEKPDTSIAQKYLQSGNYYWNSGIFIWSTKFLLSEFAKHAPKILSPLKKAMSEKKKLDYYFKQVPKLPVDIAILEKSSRLAMLPASFRWDDLGSWTSLERVLPSDSNNNCLTLGEKGQLIAQASQNNIVTGPNGLVALLGVNNLVIVQEEDVLLLAHRDSVGDIKNFLEQMRKNPSLQKYTL